ncbi:MAG TPA: hypothetical protein VGB67_01365, partial [Fibrella sp.]
MPKHASESYVNGYASPLVHTHVATTDLTATGTKDNTTYLRGDNTWATPAGGGGGGTSDTLLGSPLISNAKYINVTDDSFTSGDILYQVPTGRKAVVTSASFYNGSGAGNTNYMYYGLLLDTPTPTLTVIAITTASTANVTRRTVNGRPFILEAVDTVRWSAASTTSCVVALTILEFDDSSPLVSKSASAATGTYRNNHTTVGTSGLQPLYTPASGKQAAILTDANLLMSTFTPTSDLGL